MCQQQPPNTKPRIRPAHQGMDSPAQPWVLPCRERAFIGSLQAWQIQNKGRKSFYVQLFIPNSLSWGGGRKAGTDQDSLVNECPKKHYEQKPSPPSAFPTKYRSTFLNLFSTLAHKTGEVHTQHTLRHNSWYTSYRATPSLQFKWT